MSDLAPFVASQLRDKVVTDLQEENQKLQNQLDNAHKIEITGYRGQPVYATGKFQEGHRTNICDDHWDWEVDCEAIESAPISIFQGIIEIYLGGVQFEASTPEDRFVYMDERDWDGDERKEISFMFGGSSKSNKLFNIDFRIEGWPKDHWMGFQERDADVLKDELSVLYPQATVTIPRISFTTHCVRRVLDNLGIPVSEEV